MLHSDERWGGLLGRVPVFPGKLRLVDAAAFLFRISSGNEGTVRLWRRVPFSVDLSDRIQRQMWAGAYEPHVTRALRAVLRPGDSFVDIGAHIGYHSHLAAGLVGPGGAVFAFEPDPEMFKRLKRNLEPFPAAHALHAAVFERDMNRSFERSPIADESGWGTLTSVGDTPRGHRVTVPCHSLDSWSTAANLTALRAVKLDAEGSESSVVVGAQALLRRFRPVIVLELNGVLLRQAGSSAIALQELLRRERYVMYQLKADQLREIVAPQEFDLADAVAVPEEETRKILESLKQFGFSAMKGQVASG